MYVGGIFSFRNKTSSKNKGNSHSNNMQMLLSKESHWGWGEGSEVKSTCCSPMGLSSVQDPTSMFWSSEI